MQSWTCVLALLVVVAISLTSTNEDQKKKWEKMQKLNKCFDESKFTEAEIKEKNECCQKMKDGMAKWMACGEDKTCQETCKKEGMEELGKKEINCDMYKERVTRCTFTEFKPDLTGTHDKCCPGGETKNGKDYFTCCIKETTEPTCNPFPDCK